MDFTGGLPLLPLDEDPSALGPDPSVEAFDYAAFLSLGTEQDVDYDYLAEEATSSTSHTLAASNSPELAPLSLRQQQQQQQQQLRQPASPPLARGSDAAHSRQRLERRGHTKSR